MARLLLSLVKVLLISALLSMCISSFINSEFFVGSFNLCMIVHLTVYEWKIFMQEHVKSVEVIKLAIREIQQERLEHEK